MTTWLPLKNGWYSLQHVHRQSPHVWHQPDATCSLPILVHISHDFPPFWIESVSIKEMITWLVGKYSAHLSLGVSAFGAGLTLLHTGHSTPSSMGPFSATLFIYFCRQCWQKEWRQFRDRGLENVSVQIGHCKTFSSTDDFIASAIVTQLIYLKCSMYLMGWRIGWNESSDRCVRHLVWNKQKYNIVLQQGNTYTTY
jgi:hypothetical protein